MNISPHLVHLRITEERDYEAHRLDSKNTNVLYAKTDDLNFQFHSGRAISSVSANAVRSQSAFLHFKLVLKIT